MDVRIYKINTGITGRNFSSDKRSNFPIGGKTNSFYSIGNLMRGIEDFYLEGNLYFIDKEEELEKFYNPLGDRWVAKKKYYISHPKKERENYLLEASKFHEYIVREQLLEIANYLHHELNINYLKIEVLKLSVCCSNFLKIFSFSSTVLSNLTEPLLRVALSLSTASANARFKSS